MIVPVFRGIVVKGKLVLQDENRLKEYISTLENKIINLTICVLKTKRSIKQNKYFHGVIVKIISDYTGYSEEETKLMLKSLFLKTYKTIKIGKEEIEFEIIRNTSSLNTEEFEEFNSKIRCWASTKNIYIPLPNEVVIEEGY